MQGASVPRTGWLAWDAIAPEAGGARRSPAGGAIGPPHWRALMARNRAKRWAGRLIADVRAGRLTPPEDSALAVIAGYRNREGKPLQAYTAAVELLNVLRPTVAVSVFIVFAALA